MNNYISGVMLAGLTLHLPMMAPTHTSSGRLIFAQIASNLLQVEEKELHHIRVRSCMHAQLLEPIIYLVYFAMSLIRALLMQ